MHYPTLLRLLPLALASFVPPLSAEPAPVAIIPQPLVLKQAENAPAFQLHDGIRVGIPTTHSELGRAAIRSLMAAGFSVLPGETENELDVHPIEHKNPEAYTLCVTASHISIGVASPAALHAAAQTLAQSAQQGNIPAMQVADAPALPHRGIMLDPCRHPISVADTKRILSLMARYKLNRLHWHLTDDQGWRIEIRKYPRLTQIGSKRKESANWLDQSRKDGKPVEFFYTQEDIRSIVEHAHSLGIIIIPEIEIPGHASAAVAAYPQLGNQDCPGFAPQVITGWGVFPHIMAPSPFTFQFIEDVLAEVCDLFPLAPCIHIGGDEVPHDQWKASPAAQAFMQQHGYTRESQIQDHFTHLCAQILRKLGRRMVGWDEIMCAPQLPHDTIIMAWRSMGHARLAAARGHQVILCPIQAFYFNFSQGNDPADPFYTGLSGFNNINWQHILAFNTQVDGNSIIGMQANLWSECIPDMRKLEYMLVPRICALAEKAWLHNTHALPAGNFGKRLRAHYPYFDSLNLNFRQENGNPRKASRE